jgi:WD40 repeat protein
MGFLVGLHPKAPVGVHYWVLAGGIGGGIGTVIALWGAVALQLRARHDLDATAGMGFCVSLVAGLLGGSAGGAVDGGPWDLLFGGMWGLLLGGGIALLGALLGRLVGGLLMPLAGPSALLGLVGGASAAVGAGLFQTNDANEMLPAALRMLAGAIGGLAGTVAARVAGRTLPERGSLLCLGVGVLVVAILAGYFLSQSPLVASLVNYGRVAAANLSADGTQVVVAGDGNDSKSPIGAGVPRILTLSTNSSRSLADDGTRSAADLAFTPDGKRILGPALWDIDTGKVQRMPKVVIPVERIRLDGGWRTPGESEQSLRKVATLPGNQYALLGVGGSSELGSDLALWDLVGDLVVTCVQAHKGELTALAVSPDGQHAVTGSGDKTLIVWRVKPEALEISSIRTITANNGILAVAIAPDGKTVAATYDDHLEHAVYLWDAESGQPTRTISGHGRKVAGLVFLPDGRLLSGSEDGTVRLWDTGSGTELRRFHVQAKVAGLRIDATGKRFLVVPEMGRLRVFQIP